MATNRRVPTAIGCDENTHKKHEAAKGSQLQVPINVADASAVS
jgi:hypothetical protein